MIVLGLAGQAGVGKDTCADYLVKRYGFMKFSFSDALYREVAEAFQVGEPLLRSRETKEIATPLMAGENCANDEFVRILQANGVVDGAAPISPRQVLQLWGTEYRRAQNPMYWIDQADKWIFDIWSMYQYPEQRPQFFVNTSVRFPNERDWVHKFTNGQVWHIRRDSLPGVTAHVSETPLEVGEYERELYNNDTIERLHNGIELLLSTQAKFVKVEPMLPPATEI